MAIELGEVEAEMNKVFAKVKLLFNLLLALFKIFHDPVSNSCSTGRKMRC